MMMNNVQITPNMVSEKAFYAYSNSTYRVQTDGCENYFIEGKFVGDLDDVNDFYEGVFDEKRGCVNED